MLSRHVRGGVSAHRTAVLRSTGLSSRRLARRSYAPALARQYVLTRQFRPWGRRGSESGHGDLHERHLATAVNNFAFDGAPYNHLSDSALPQYQSPPPPPPPRSHDFKPFNPAAPLTIPESESRRGFTRTNRFGVPGEVEDMVAVFDACVRVGKLDRAALFLKRLNADGTTPGEQRILLHNQYLRASLQQMRTSPDRQQVEKLHQWYELEIRSKCLPHTAETIACMLKASLLSERGSRLDRLVSRYMGMAPGEAGLRVLSMADILSDQDLAIITDICPTYNFAADAEAKEAALVDLEERNTTGIPVDIEPDGSSAPFEPVPDLAATPQKGEGLATLKRGLQLVSQLQDVDTSKLTDAERHEIQLQIERDSISAAVDKWRQQHEKMAKMGLTSVAPSTAEGSLSQVMSTWLVSIEAKIKEEIALVEASESKTEKTERDLARCLYGPILREADPARLAAVTILATLNSCATIGVDKGVAVSGLVTNISKLAQEDIAVQKKEKAKKARRRQKVRFTGPRAPPAEAASQDSATGQDTIIDGSEEAERNVENEWWKPWSMNLKTHVGSFLAKLLVESAKVEVIRKHPTSEERLSQSQPAFSHRQIPRKGRRVGVIFLNGVLVEKLKREPMGDYLAKHLPMIVEPKPWTSFSEGGFLDSKTNIVRLKSNDEEQQLYTKAAIKQGDMAQVFKGLDVLGKTAWQVNRQILDVMMEAWNSGVAIANMPPLNPDLDAPPEPDSTADPLQRRVWTKAVKAVENERCGLHSQRCFMNLQLEVARTFRNQTIYFPHNLDYRGRAYPMPTYLNHMGSDHARALLKFAEGKELGARGLRWLKIHLANVYGLDKASFDEREAFATEHLAQIAESATDPLGGSRWWLKAEDPWQCLAACFELKSAHDSPDPAKYVCHFPVHQDGTCNGLQHYAALGGDAWGAKQVNLEPGDKPADVYSAVANLVKQGIAEEAEAGNPFAAALNGKITRKVVKQTVMTNVYGVTYAGAKKQVCKQLDALYPNLPKESGFTNMLLAAYVAKHTFQALTSMFRGAHDIQYWLGEIGGRVCRALTPSQLQQMADSHAEASSRGSGKAEKAAAKRPAKSPTKSPTKSPSGAKGFNELAAHFRSTVVWTTPLRMPVAQPYRKRGSKCVRTCLQSIKFPAGDQTDPVHRRKQLQGFPPNFIHSLDASHMLLSALECERRGVGFAAVHDSFWTHAADVDVMNGVIRDSFIRVHEEDVVGRLAAEFEARHKGSLYLAHIDPDSEVAKKIKELRKNSQLTPRDELLLEHKRNSLRLSGNPWDLEAAKQIVTPASVYEDMEAAEEDVDIKEQVKEIALGEIPSSESIPVGGAAAARAKKRLSEEEDGENDDGENDDGENDDGENEDGENDKGENDKGQTGEVEAQSSTTSFAKSILEKGNKTHFETTLHPPRRSSAKVKTPLQIWLPLTIPAIPKKGDFDVTRLRESKYFFS